MGKGSIKGKGVIKGKGKGPYQATTGASGSGEPTTHQQGPFPIGTFPPGSYSAHQQRLYENLPTQLKEAYRKEATGQVPMSVDEKNAYDHLASIFSHMEETNTWIEMLMERGPVAKRDRDDLVVWRAELAALTKEWEDFAKEPVKVIGSIS